MRNYSRTWNKQWLIASALSMAVTVCISNTAHSRQAVEEATEKIEEIHATVSLPQLSGDLEPVPDAMRITIARDGIYVDVASFLQSAPDEVRQRFIDILRDARFPYDFVEKAQSLEQFMVLPADSSAEYIDPEPVLSKLSSQVLFSIWDGPASAKEIPLVIHADQEAPFQLVADMLGVAREDLRRVNDMDPFEQVWLVVESDGHPAAIKLEPPAPEVYEFEKPKVCAGPLAYLFEDGIGLYAQAYTPDGKSYRQARLSHDPDPDPKYPEWADALVVDEARTCPSIPDHEGRRDLGRLADLAHRLTATEPGCTVTWARFGAVPGVTWGNVARVVGTLYEAGFQTIRTEPRPWYIPEGCEGALTLR